MIKTKHPAREPIAGLSTTSNYYNYKSDFVPLVDRILLPYGWSLGAFNMPGDEGRTAAPIEDENNVEIGQLNVSWYKMPSGRFEVIIYVI